MEISVHKCCCMEMVMGPIKKPFDCIREHLLSAVHAKLKWRMQQQPTIFKTYYHQREYEMMTEGVVCACVKMFSWMENSLEHIYESMRDNMTIPFSVITPFSRGTHWEVSWILWRASISLCCLEQLEYLHRSLEAFSLYMPLLQFFIIETQWRLRNFFCGCWFCQNLPNLAKPSLICLIGCASVHQI